MQERYYWYHFCLAFLSEREFVSLCLACALCNSIYAMNIFFRADHDISNFVWLVFLIWYWLTCGSLMYQFGLCDKLIHSLHSWTLSQVQKILNSAGLLVDVDPTKNHYCAFIIPYRICNHGQYFLGLSLTLSQTRSSSKNNGNV